MWGARPVAELVNTAAAGQLTAADSDTLTNNLNDNDDENDNDDVADKMGGDHLMLDLEEWSLVLNKMLK